MAPDTTGAAAAGSREGVARGDRRVASSGDSPEPVRRTRDGPVQVLYVDDDPEYLDLVGSLLDERGIAVRTESDPETVPDRLEGVDCVVSDYEMPGMDGLDVLGAVREHDESLPFVLYTRESREAVVDPLYERPATSFLGKGSPASTVPLLARRIRLLVARGRLGTLATRSLSALEATNDAVAVVAPDGTIAFVNQAYQTRLGYDGESLVGRHWHECYPDGEVSRIESRALPTVEDGWQWTGQCVGKRRDGEQFTAQTRIVGLDDGTLVICHPRTGDGD